MSLRFRRRCPDSSLVTEVDDKLDCRGCGHPIVDLREVTEARGLRLLAEHAAHGEVCMRAWVDAEGVVSFLREPSSRRRLPVVPAALATALAACGPGSARSEHLEAVARHADIDATDPPAAATVARFVPTKTEVVADAAGPDEPRIVLRDHPPPPEAGAWVAAPTARAQPAHDSRRPRHPTGESAESARGAVPARTGRTSQPVETIDGNPYLN